VRRWRSFTFLLLGTAVTALASGCSEPAAALPPGSGPLAPTPAPVPPEAKKPVTPANLDATQDHPVDKPAPRIYAKARFAWIQTAPRASQGWIGYLSLGGSVALRGGSIDAARVKGGGSGCDTWYAVEPRGYVCAGETATIDPDDPVVVALAKDAPKIDSPWPYEYGESLGAPRYSKIPSAAEQRGAEWDLDAHMTQVERARAVKEGEAVDKDIAGVDLTPAGVPAPEPFSWSPLVREGRTWIANGSTVAYTRGFDVEGRTFLLAHDKAIIPKDRIRPYPRSSFQGVALGGAVKLPIAFFRKKERPKYRKAEDGSFQKTDERWPAHGFVALTGEETKVGSQTFLATVEPSIYALAGDSTVLREATAAPAGKGEPTAKGRRTWVDVSVLGGWLVAYEGMTPVFATLISPGRGGIPYEGKDPIETASTPTGNFRVDGKFVTATMVSSTNDLLVHTEVQFVQNFHGAHALHGAYWHDAWGDPKSGGCVNLSPIDAKWLFAWSEPTLPEGWYGLRSVPEAGPVTAVAVHR